MGANRLLQARDLAMQIFEATLDELLSKRRSLAHNMLSGAPDIQVSELGEVLIKKG